MDTLENSTDIKEKIRKNVKEIKEKELRQIKKMGLGRLIMEAQRLVAMDPNVLRDIEDYNWALSNTIKYKLIIEELDKREAEYLEKNRYSQGLPLL